MTDDLGHYRIGGLRDGEYMLDGSCSFTWT